MGLNIAQASGDFLPYVKYNGKAGRWYVKKDDQEVEVQNPTFVADFDNIRTGWLSFAEGQAPDVVFDKDLSTPAPKPSDRHKRGFNLKLFSNAQFGGVVELQGSSMHLNNAINELYELYEKDRKDGQLPVVSCTGTTPMKDKMGTNYRPIFKIEKWIDRPTEFDGGATQEAKPEASTPVSSSISEF